MIEFKLPELGENIDQGDLVRLMVAPGATVNAGQSVMELETDKAVVEVPSSVSGTVQEIRVKEGDKIKVGQVIFTVDGADGNSAAVPAKQEEPEAKPAKAAPQKPPAKKEAAKPSPTPAAASKPAPPSSVSAAPPAPAATSPATASSGASEFTLPELGENISQGDLVRLMISPGTKVSEGQPVMELGDGQGVVEVPSSVSGVVKEIKVKEGEKIKVGQVIFTLEGGVPRLLRRVRPYSTRRACFRAARRPARLPAAMSAEGKTEQQALPPDRPQPAPPSFTMPVQLGKVAGTEHREPVPAAPHVRRLAREIGLDIYNVKAQAPSGRISEDDVKAAKAKLAGASPAPQTPQAGRVSRNQNCRTSPSGAKSNASRCAEFAAKQRNIYAKHGIPFPTSHSMTARTSPNSNNFVVKFAPRAEEAGGKMTVTAIALKVCASALKVFPQFNASIDIEKEEIVYKQYINIGSLPTPIAACSSQ